MIPMKYRYSVPFKSIYTVVHYTLLVPIVFIVYVLFSYIFTTHITNPNQFVDSMKNYPLGIFTSLFIFDGVGNVFVFVLFYVIFLCLVMWITKSYVSVDREIVNKLIKHLTLFSTTAMFAIAIVGNLFWVEVYRVGTRGQSGVVSSFMGIVVSIILALPIHFVAVRIAEAKKLTVHEVPAIAVILILVYIIKTYSSQVFNVSNGVASPIHAITFFIGLSSGFVFFWIYNRIKIS